MGKMFERPNCAGCQSMERTIDANMRCKVHNKAIFFDGCKMPDWCNDKHKAIKKE